MDKKRIAQLFRELADEFESAEPVQPATPEPTGDTIPVRIFFYGMSHSYKSPIDIKINDTWYNFSKNFEQKFKINGAVGTVIEVPFPITRIEFRESQIRFANLNENGFGWTNIKYGAVPSQDNLLDVNENKWSRWENGKANHTARWGDLNRSHNDDGFYKIDVPSSFNDPGKFAIYVSGYGENRP